jgi:hypothetical protein
VLAVVEEVERLDPAARTEVQRPLRVPPDGGLHQCGGRLADAQDVVMPQHARLLVRSKVAGHPQFGPAAAVLVRIPAVGPEVRLGGQPPRAGNGLQQPQLQQALDADARQGGVERFPFLGFGQEPQTDDGGKRRCALVLPDGALGSEQGRDGLVPVQRSRRGGPEQPGDAVERVTEPAQVSGERREQFGKVAARGVGGVAGGELVMGSRHRTSLVRRDAPPGAAPGSAAWSRPGGSVEACLPDFPSFRAPAAEPLC